MVCLYRILNTITFKTMMPEQVLLKLGYSAEGLFWVTMTSPQTPLLLKERGCFSPIALEESIFPLLAKERERG